MSVSIENLISIEITPDMNFNFPPAPAGYERFVLQSIQFDNPEIVNLCNDSHLPARIELSIIRNNDNNDDYHYRLNAYNKEWRGKNIEEVVVTALKDTTENLLSRRMECAKYKAAVYDQSVLAMSNIELTNANGEAINKVAMEELHRMNYEGFPSNITNPEVIFERKIDPEDIGTEYERPDDKAILAFCEQVGGIIPGIKLVKATWHDPKKEEESVESYYCNFPVGGVGSADPISALGDAAFYEMLNHLHKWMECEHLKLENARLKEKLRIALENTKEAE